MSFSWSPTILCNIYLYINRKRHLFQDHRLMVPLCLAGINNNNKMSTADITALTQSTSSSFKCHCLILNFFYSGHRNMKTCSFMCSDCLILHTRESLSLNVMLAFMSYQIISPSSHWILQLSTLIHLLSMHRYTSMHYL